ncbi:MAG TPA: hypothetical protein DCL61_02645 [Cyanobacteria bacterium UBA12227]|nr:hypothetical protein [Cyanobacteria bacterium UBA12227]HAX87493.1 hypothetical protein [Cyanobacteria bacterium UBA11370]HBY78245.1 hypothetical protein [Cyanobacteria bacterium UBA11148]
MTYNQSPGNSNQNPGEPTGQGGQLAPNEKSVTWENAISSVKQNRPSFFNWILSWFNFGNSHNYDQQKVLEEAIKNPEKLFDAFSQLQHQYAELENTNKKLTKEINELNSSKQQQNHNYNQQYNVNYQLQQQIQTLKNNNSLLQQENQRLERENRRTIELQSKIENLKTENQELKARLSAKLSNLAELNRDKSKTVTSDDSRRQRDVLTPEFLNFNNQDFTDASNKIFNHIVDINPQSKDNRKREIARIKSTLSQQILKEGRNLLINNKSMQEEELTKTISRLTDSLLANLEISKECPQEILKTLHNLVEKGLKLVKDIVNDEPPGEFLIENEGTDFNPEKHQHVNGCESSGKILYTTYPGYSVNNRIIGDALKAFVYTVSEEEWKCLKTKSDTHNEQITTNNAASSAVSENNEKNNPSADQSNGATETSETEQNPPSVSDKVKSIKAAGKTVDEIAKKLGVSVATINNWETEKGQPTRENAEKLDQFYKEVCGGDPSGNKNTNLFTGKVSKKEGTYLYNSPKTRDNNLNELRKYNEVLKFDSSQEGETVQDIMSSKTNNIWLRVAETNYWVPRLYIDLDKSS